MSKLIESAWDVIEKLTFGAGVGRSGPKQNVSGWPMIASCLDGDGEPGGVLITTPTGSSAVPVILVQ